MQGLLGFATCLSAWSGTACKDLQGFMKLQEDDSVRVRTLGLALALGAFRWDAVKARPRIWAFVSL